MLRSSSMLITSARGMRNAAKLPFRFTFEILIDSVDKIPITGPVVLVWERGSAKVISTNPVNVDNNSRKANFRNERLSSEITLFKSSPQDKKFQEKVVKLAIRGGSADGKTICKIHLNLADHAELPSGTKKVSAALNNGSTLIATVNCQFISMGRATPKSGNGNRNGLLHSMSNHTLGGGKLSSPMAGDTDARDMCRMDSESTISAQECSPTSGGDDTLKGKLKYKGSKKMTGRKSGRDNGVFTEGISNDSGMEKLKRENLILRKQLEEMDKNRGGGDSRLLDENKSLKAEIDSLKDALKRDPEFHELVAQLKETKMALAILQLERDQIALEVMNQRDSPRTV